ncbi:sensor histidine kinase [Paraclostridium bifermentans]|uniref:sensor histidine kinase n=1 Tax=Paraclostridium bifermentans TaxID=1490 RepID=UPI001FF52691|nr:sensor histidine kinase [Paraclostridium bifermentans]UOW68639.1 sensor histidine kinase [Paraclostridium bifermentans]
MAGEGIVLNLLEKTSFLIVILILMSKIKILKNILKSEQNNKRNLIIISGVFSFLAIVGTYLGIDVDGSMANVRNIAIVSGGMLFGPIVGVTAGIVAGVHRFLIDINGITAIPCFLTSVLAGVLSGYLCNRVDSDKKWVVGIICGMFVESMSMEIILILSRPYDIAVSIVRHIYIPMMIGQVGIGFLISILQSLRREKEEIAAQQAKLSLDIANKTLPYFRNMNKNSLNKVCEIIKNDIDADAVSITDRKVVLSYVGIGEDYFKNNNKTLSNITKECIIKGEIIYIKEEQEEYLVDKKTPLKTAMLIPLKENDETVGTLKIYYSKQREITESRQALAIGLSQMISTLMEISKVEQMKEAANKAEIKALQTQINPHFLFNALNTITSFIRINPDIARNLIINLATFLRYNLEFSDTTIDIKKELEQVKAYVEIEKARFGDKLNVIYDIDEDVNIKIPSLIIQPLVENAIIHGIRANGGHGTVKISVKNKANKIYISVENDGVTIDEDIIKKVKNGNMPENKIGLYNVHLRMKLMYGKGLSIKRLNPGTKIEFSI